MNSSYIIVNNKNDMNKIVRELNKSFGLPKINCQLSIYSRDQDNELIFRFQNRKCEYKINKIDKPTNYFIEVHPHNVKTCLDTFYGLGFQKGIISDATDITYKITDKESIRISMNTIFGNIIKLESNLKTRKDIEVFLGEKYKFLSPKEFDLIKNNISKKRNIKYDSLILNNHKVLDNKIINYFNNVGIPISSNLHSLAEILHYQGNNFSFLEYPYKIITGNDLLGNDNTSYLGNFKVSIIIPYYNSFETINKSLLSIESQDISKNNLKDIEVIVIDDGSDISAEEIIKKNYNFCLRIIRLKTNQGRSKARNIGINLANNDKIICIDGDILLSKDYVKDHCTRLSIINSSIFISFRRNIPQNHQLTLESSITSGLLPPESYDDNRISRYVSKKQTSYYPIKNNNNIDILCESNYFKNLGFGRNIGIYDLPSIVSSHNISFCKKNIPHLFNTNFKGWGLEDTYFGATSIAGGNFIIPVLSSGVYHITTIAKDGTHSKKQKSIDLKNNMKIYKDLLSKEIDE